MLRLQLMTQCREESGAGTTERVPEGDGAALAAALAQAFACPGLQVQVGPVQDSPALRHQAQAQARQRGAEAIVANDAQVQALIAQYGATIVPGSIRPL